MQMGTNLLKSAFRCVSETSEGRLATKRVEQGREEEEEEEEDVASAGSTTTGVSMFAIAVGVAAAGGVKEEGVAVEVANGWEMTVSELGSCFCGCGCGCGCDCGDEEERKEGVRMCVGCCWYCCDDCAGCRPKCGAEKAPLKEESPKRANEWLLRVGGGELAFRWAAGAEKRWPAS